MDGVFFAIDAAVGRDGGGPPDFDSIEWHDLLALYLLWAIIFALMQFFAARASGWTKTVWIEAGLQTAAILFFTVVGGAGFLPGLVIPWVIALLLLRKTSLPALIARDRARRAARFPGSPA